MLHPYHKYIVLFDRDLDMMVERVLRTNLDAAQKHLEMVENQIKKAKDRSHMIDNLHLSVAQQVLAQAKSELDLWHNKKIKQVKQEQVETLF
jgi:hypothetical protein